MYILFAIIIVVLLLLWSAVRGRRMQVATPEAAEVAIVPVDLDAFRNLSDASQDTYLREHLSPAEYRRVARARFLAVAEYLWKVAHNSRVMLSLAHSGRLSEQSEVEKQSAEMASAAFSLRVFCLLALAQAYAGYVFPGTAVSVGRVADGYDRLTAKLWAMRHTWTPVRTAS